MITLQTIDLRVIDAENIRELLVDYQRLLKSSIACATTPGKRTAFDPDDKEQLAKDRYNLYRAQGLATRLKELQEAAK